MPSCPPATGRRATCRPGLRLVLAAAAVGAATLTASAPATASPALAPVSHPGSDRMGSTVAAHEGRAPARAAGPAGSEAVAGTATRLRGLDVSHWQGDVDWAAVWAKGGRFAYMKATESTTYTDPYFKQNYNGSYAAGLIRGAYHFALPDRASGTAQADFFVDHGGGWSPDGRTLPPVLDIEYNPYGGTCYGMGRRAMVSWIRAFSDQVQARIGRTPAIYTTTDWWNQCTGSNTGFGSTHPLFLARYADAVGPLPAGWRSYAFWQYADSGKLPGDQDLYNGQLPRLETFARG